MEVFKKEFGSWMKVLGGLGVEFGEVRRWLGNLKWNWGL